MMTEHCVEQDMTEIREQLQKIKQENRELEAELRGELVLVGD